MGENVWDFRKRLTLLVGSAVIIAVVFFIFKVLFYYVWQHGWLQAGTRLRASEK